MSPPWIEMNYGSSNGYERKMEMPFSYGASLTLLKIHFVHIKGVLSVRILIK
jgi:hypothetical protein